MFSRSATICDAVYSFKDYKAESDKVQSIIRAKNPGAKSLLDVACGTGKHLEEFQKDFECEGLDISDELLSVARHRLPGMTFTSGDMRHFDLGRSLDAVVCLFSAIGYAETVEGLNSTAECFAEHLNPGGVAIVEPWLSPDKFLDGNIGLQTVDQPDLKVARMNSSRREGDLLSVLHFEYLVGTSEGLGHYSETHRLALFTDDHYRDAFESQGLTVEHDPDGLTGRGLFIASRPA